MPLTVMIDTETGTASLHPSLPLPADQDLRFSLQDTRSRLYLTPSGWSPTRKTLFQARLTDENATLHLDPAVTSLLEGGAPLLLEEIYVNYREALIWPELPVVFGAPDPLPPVTAAETAHADAPEFVGDKTETSFQESPETAPPDETLPREEERRRTLPVVLGAVGVAATLVVALVVMVWTSSAINPLSDGTPASTEIPPATANAAPASTSATSGDAPSAPEMSASDSEIAALKTTVADLKSQLKLAEIEVGDLRGRAFYLEGELKAARAKTVAPPAPAGSAAQLQAQIEQQKQTIQSMRKQLDGRPSAPGPSAGGSTLDLLRDRNSQLTEETAEQRARIARLEDELAEATEALIIMKETAAATNGPSGGFGALAAADDGTVFLTEQGYSSEGDARDAAMAGCLQFSRSFTCSVRRTFSNTCAAVARVDPPTKASRWYLSLGPSRTGAENNAMSSCYTANQKRCHVTVPGVCIGS